MPALAETPTPVLDRAGGNVADGGASGHEPAARAVTPLVDSELLVEEISIDGMCGVY